jgi:hypothetical protein
VDVYGSLGSLADSLRESATVEKVYGEPIEAMERQSYRWRGSPTGWAVALARKKSMMKKAEKRSARPAKAAAGAFLWSR